MNRVAALLLFSLFLFTACAAPVVPVDGTAAGKSESSEESTAPAKPVVRHLMVGGDIMCHMAQVNDAYNAEDESYHFDHMFAAAADLLQGADYAVGNLETVFGGGPDYSGFPNFSSPDALAEAAKKAGFDLLGTANNHTKDQGMDGIFRTLDVLDSLGLAHVGTCRTQAERDKTHGIYVADVGGISVAFLCYTYGLNGYLLPDDMKYAVNIFNLDYDTTLTEFDYDLVSADMAAARALKTDLIAVLMHWGVEYNSTPWEYQEETARWLMEQGADLVLGGHPHVLQPYETIRVSDENGRQKTGFVVYSLGNFISAQNYDPSTMTTVLLDLELTKEPSGKTTLTDVCYTPFYMLYRSDLPFGQQRRLVDIHVSMEAYENGETDLITPSVYSRLQMALDYCHGVLGEEGDVGGRK